MSAFLRLDAAKRGSKTTKIKKATSLVAFFCSAFNQVNVYLASILNSDLHTHPDDQQTCTGLSTLNIA